jgi:hypothetical protein
MWEPRRLTTLWAFMACFRDSFTFFMMTEYIEMFPTEVFWILSLAVQNRVNEAVSHEIKEMRMLEDILFPLVVK